MAVTTEQIRNGAMNFIQHEVINKLQVSPNTIQYGLIVAGVKLWASHNLGVILSNSTLASTLGLIDENGHYDIDRLADEFKKTMTDAGYRIELPALQVIHNGFTGMTLYRQDIENLVGYIKNA